MKTLFSLLVTSGFLLMTACQSAAVPEKNQDKTGSNPVVPSETNKPMQIIPQTPPPDSESVNEGVTMPADANAQRMAQLAKESLARKFKISEDQIYLSSVEAMTWPDAGLGCPQAGIVYAQVITPGFQILFEAIGESYSYHTDNIDKVVLCQIHPPDNIFPTPE